MYFGVLHEKSTKTDILRVGFDRKTVRAANGRQRAANGRQGAANGRHRTLSVSGSIMSDLFFPSSCLGFVLFGWLSAVYVVFPA